MMEVCLSSWRKRGLFRVKYDALYHCVFAQHFGNLGVHIVVKYDIYCSSVFDAHDYWIFFVRKHSVSTSWQNTICTVKQCVYVVSHMSHVNLYTTIVYCLLHRHLSYS